jgi:hypothetical protein
LEWVASAGRSVRAGGSVPMRIALRRLRTASGASAATWSGPVRTHPPSPHAISAEAACREIPSTGHVDAEPAWLGSSVWSNFVWNAYPHIIGAFGLLCCPIGPFQRPGTVLRLDGQTLPQGGLRGRTSDHMHQPRGESSHRRPTRHPHEPFQLCGHRPMRVSGHLPQPPLASPPTNEQCAYTIGANPQLLVGPRD